MQLLLSLQIWYFKNFNDKIQDINFKSEEYRY